MDALLKIDRRWIFLFLLLAMVPVVAFGDGMKFKIEPSSLVRGVHDAIEALPARAPILFAIDFDPASRAEVDPVTRAGLRQAFRKNLRVIAMTHWPTGVDMAREIVEQTAAEFDDLEVDVLGSYETRKAALEAAIGTPSTATASATSKVNTGRRTVAGALSREGREGVSPSRAGSLVWRQDLHDALHAAKIGAAVIAGGAGPSGKGFDVLRVRSRTPSLVYGKDYCFLGTKAGEQVLVIAMGESIPTAFPTDPHTGRPTRELPVMEGVRSLKDLAYLFTITSGAQADWWIIYGASKHRFKMGVACTAVVAPDLYPYVSTGQITGLCGGVKGAWEYETLIGTPGKATTYVPAQTVAHCVLIFLIMVCNAAYFVGRRKS